MADGGTLRTLPPHFSTISLPHVAARATALVRTKLRAMLHRHGLNEAAWLALTAMLDGKARTVTDLADLCGQQQPTMTKALDSLEAFCLVFRTQDERDRRVTHVALSVKGTKLAERLAAEWEKTQDAVLADLSAHERDAIGLAFRALPTVASRKKAATKRVNGGRSYV